jgi:hypothetical protein
MDEKVVCCPFCEDGNFDLIGLKRHLLNGWCEIFNMTDTVSLTDDARVIQEQAQKHNLPIFQAYLRGEDVEDQLPFFGEASLEFKDLMDKELEEGE